MTWKRLTGQRKKKSSNMKKTLKAILNQGVDIVFGLLALFLLILHYVRFAKLDDMFKELYYEFESFAMTGYALKPLEMVEQIQERINDWQEINFLWLVVGYVAFNVINKVQMNLRNEEELIEEEGK
jgi:F0F1-type ATP synthase assembly protein I